MKKAEMDVVLLSQIIGLVMAGALIMGTFSYCSKQLGGNDNFKSVDSAIKELQKGEDITSNILLFSKNQFGVFFREQSPYVIQVANDCWDATTKSSGGVLRSNPERDCLANTKIPIIIKRPSQCSINNNCYCEITPKEKLGGIEFDNINGEFVFGGNNISKVAQVNIDSVKCKSITVTPAIYSELKMTKEVTQEVERPNEGVQGENTVDVVNALITQYVITEGGVIMAPIISQSYNFYFAKGNNEINKGFIVCKYEESCK